MAIEKLTEFAKTGQKDTDQLDIETGFIVNRKPARQWFNWLFNTLTVKINEIIDADFIPKNDIVDNLTTENASKPVSAKQAKILKETITAIEDIVLYSPVAFPSIVIPSGYLALMGQTISQAQYPKLFALYGSALPDMRAYTIRGIDYGRGIDSGRSILSEQGDAIRNITGSFGEVRPSPDANYTMGIFESSGAFYSNPGKRNSVGGTTMAENTENNRAQLYFDASRVVPVSSENRVKNIAFLYIVKAG